MKELILHNFSAGAFLNEQLMPGYIGKFLIFLLFFASGLSTLSYFLSIYINDEREKSAWLRLGRIAFWAHGIAIIGVFATLFYIIFSHRFEYYYAWRHSNMEMPLKYIISCFWEGQEGSFLLWMFWHFILGIVLMYSSIAWEKYTMSILTLVQLVLASMLLGVYVFGKKIGVNPFVLLRDEMSNAPIFQRPEYLSLIKDGNGLNVLLQNYWMTIHPPVLFLGFASTVFPFVYAVGALLKKDYNGWVQKALPWSLFSMCVLGTGIIMGGAWAYEALSFGGFWAWDPVENASLVPWIIGVAALHLLVVYKSTKNGIHLSFVFSILCFVMIIYSTFLTRSGVLGESSVHSFTDEGLGWQLVFMLVIFSIPAFILYGYHAIMKMPKNAKDEEVNTREFWMFVGALVLCVSAFFITKTTSIELWNKIFGTHYSQPSDIKFHHNKIQLIFGITITFFTAITQYLGYKRSSYTGMNWLWGSLGISFIISIALIILYQFIPSGSNNPNFSEYYMGIANSVLLLAAIFSFLANAAYLFQFQKKNLLQSGGSIAHIGFAILVAGIVISQYKQTVISKNTENILYDKSFDSQTNADNKLLYKNVPVVMDEYLVTYTGRKQEGDKTYFRVHYEKWDPKEAAKPNAHQATGDTFVLLPYMQRNGKKGDLVANPSTKHFITKDVFSNITSFNSNEAKELETTIDTISIGDTFFTQSSYVVLDSLVGNPPIDSITYSKSIFGVGAYFTIKDLEGASFMAIPSYLIDVSNNNQIIKHPFYNDEAAIRIQVEQILPEQQKIAISYTEFKKPQDFIILRTILFPQINWIWIGTVIMVLGGLISAWKRHLENKRIQI